MARTFPWWRRLGAALAAVVLAVLTFGPSLDGFICRDEASSLDVAAADAPAVTAPDESAHHGGDGLDACVHGHCHHGAPYVPASPVAAEAPRDLVGTAHRLAQGPLPTADPKFGLIRPPRA